MEQQGRQHPSEPKGNGVDTEYRFGRPTVYLTPRELGRLAALRSKLGDTRSDRLANAAGLAQK